MSRFAKIRLFSMLMILAVSLAGCSDDDDPANPVVTSPFEDYASWDQVEYTNAPSDFLGPAHQGNNPDFVRSIFMVEGAKSAVDGDYAEGTLVAKETYTFDAEGNKMYPEAMGLLGMMKREPGFDPEGGDWEFFNINPSTREVIDSGANLGSCKGCHTNATGEFGTDRIFNHPYEFMADAADFDDYASWPLIGTETGPDALIGGAHEGNNENATRKIYKKQLQARAVSGGWSGYPVGTLLLKRVDDEMGAIIGMTAMAKRGSGYDAENGDWEYFMMDVETEQLMSMGALPMCIGCHSAANTQGNGADYVFAHPDDPFNN